jgi:hypothetical protein
VKNIFILGFLFCSQVAGADTPPPGAVQAKLYSGDGTTQIGHTGAAINVNVTGGSGLTSTVNQGTAGSSSWLESITSSVLPTNACQETGGHLASIDTKLSTPMPVSGTFWQATQPVSGTVAVSNFPSTQAVTGTFWQATQPVSAASLPLPTGAASSAKQPALGVAGSPSTDVISVQGEASMTPLKVDGSGVTQPVSGTFWQTTQPVSGTVAVSNFPSTQAVTGTFWQATQPVSGTVIANIGTSGSLALNSSVTGLQVAQGSTTSGQSGSLTLGAVTTSAPSYSTGQSSPFSLTAAGGLRVDGSGVTQPVSGTFWQATQPISAASLPLPTGAATAAGLTTINTTLGSPFQAGGSIGNTAFIANAGTNLNTSALALESGGHLASVDAKTPALGQALAASSVPVVLTAAQVTSLTPPTSVTVTQGTGTNLHSVIDSGTITANAGTGTFAVSAASLPLPIGASTSAKQPALGTAGTPSADVITVQGATSMTALKVDGSAVTQPVSIATAPALVASSAIIGKVGIDQTTAGTTNGVSLAQIGSTTAATGNGVSGSGTLRVNIASDNSAITVNATPVVPTALTIKQASVTIGTTAVRLTNDGLAPASTRVLLVAQLDTASTANCYFGSSTVTTSGSTQGVQMFAGQTYSFSKDAGNYYAICNATSQTFHITEQE